MHSLVVILLDVIDNINAILKANGMTGADLSRQIGVSSAVYSQWNRKRTKPSSKNVVKVAAALGVSVEELTGTQKEPAPITGDGLSERDQRLLKWFRSLPPEKQKAILVAQDGPEDAAD